MAAGEQAMGENEKKIGIIMSGGGARAAYQVGVLKAVARILPAHIPNPFPVICGASAGAINAAALAVYADNFQNAVRRLERVWGNFHVDQVFRTDVRGMVGNWAKWWWSILASGFGGRQYPMSMFDRAPLRVLLNRYLPCERIQSAIDAGWLEALSITASGYNSGQSVSFYQGTSQTAPWKRAARIGVPTTLTTEHLMASSAIPLVFEAVRVHREYFGDGSMRQTAPFSPALQLGAEKLLVIGVRQELRGQPPRDPENIEYPSIAKIGSHILSSIFLDALEADLERLRRINETLRLIPDEEHAKNIGRGSMMRPVDTLLIAPSQNIGEIAMRHKKSFPRSVRVMLRGMGAWKRTGGDLLSYLLFEKPYCRELIELGYHDAMARRVEIEEFFRGAPSSPAPEQGTIRESP